MSDDKVDVTSMYRRARCSSQDVLYEEILSLALGHSRQQDFLRDSIIRVSNRSDNQIDSGSTPPSLTRKILVWLYKPSALTSGALALFFVLFISSNFLPVNQNRSLSSMYDVALATSLDDLEVSQMNIQKGLSLNKVKRNPELTRIYLGQELANKIVAAGRSTSLISNFKHHSATQEVLMVVDKIKEIDNAAVSDKRPMVIALLESDDLVFSGYWLTIFKAGLLRVESFSQHKFLVHADKIKESLEGVLSEDDLEKFDEVYNTNNSIEEWYSYTEFLSERLSLQ